MSCPSCEPWPPPPDCCIEPCNTQEGEELFNLWWPAVCEWIRIETCERFGCCDVEVAPCPPRCACPNRCGCGPWQTLNLRDVWGSCPLKVEDGIPQIEFRFPQADGTIDVVPWSQDGPFSVRPDMWTVDWCEPINTCGGWPDQDCYQPWTIAASIGREPPAMLVNAAGRFVCEIVKDCLGQDSCLPDNVTSITRRGLSMTVDNGQFDSTVINFDSNNTGVPLLDMALRTWRCTSPTFAFIDPIKYRDGLLGNRLTDDWTFRHLWPARPVGTVTDDYPAGV